MKLKLWWLELKLIIILALSVEVKNKCLELRLSLQLRLSLHRYPTCSQFLMVFWVFFLLLQLYTVIFVYKIAYILVFTSFLQTICLQLLSPISSVAGIAENQGQPGLSLSLKTHFKTWTSLVLYSPSKWPNQPFWYTKNEKNHVLKLQSLI